jgi:hypothetical protein
MLHTRLLNPPLQPMSCFTHEKKAETESSSTCAHFPSAVSSLTAYLYCALSHCYAIACKSATLQHRFVPYYLVQDELFEVYPAFKPA